MFRLQFLVIIRPYMNTFQVIECMEYNTDPYSLIDCCGANISWNYFLKVQLRLKRLQMWLRSSDLFQFRIHFRNYSKPSLQSRLHIAGSDIRRLSSCPALGLCMFYVVKVAMKCFSYNTRLQCNVPCCHFQVERVKPTVRCEQAYVSGFSTLGWFCSKRKI
jgi:hypothetical protein